MNVKEQIKKSRVIPVIVLERAEDAVPLCNALRSGGVEVAEITFRSAAAPKALELVSQRFPDFLVGAGTVTTKEEATLAKDSGAQFAVAPGLNPNIVSFAQEIGLPFFPGVSNPSDIETAMELGCSLLKFFPAEAAGGIPMLKALYGPYKHRGIEFIPTGGISEKNFNDYLSTPGVLAIGGSWLVKSNLINNKKWDEITDLAKAASSH